MKYFISILLWFIFFAGAADAYTSPGKPSGYVNDFSGVASQATKDQLESELSAFAKGGNPQIVVVTIKKLDGDPIEEYANRLFREWGIGDKTKNNGVLFLVASQDRKMRIEVGYGLEGALTDIETKGIQDGIVRPAFQQGDFDAGIRAGVTAIQRGLAGELVTPNERRYPPSEADLETYLFLGIILLSWLGSILGRSKSWWAGGIVGGVGGGIAWAFTQWLYWLPIAAILGLIFDYFVSKNYRQSDHGGLPAWWAGGGWGGWDRFGGGGFGGFGGGSSGGGGSSSSW